MTSVVSQNDPVNIHDELDNFKKNVDIFFIVVMGSIIFCKLKMTYFKSIRWITCQVYPSSFAGRIRILRVGLSEEQECNQRPFS